MPLFQHCLGYLVYVAFETFIELFVLCIDAVLAIMLKIEYRGVPSTKIVDKHGTIGLIPVMFLNSVWILRGSSVIQYNVIPSTSVARV